jgi:hypothetical protein
VIYAEIPRQQRWLSTDSKSQPGGMKGGGAYGQVTSISGIRSRMSNNEHRNEVSYDEIPEHTESGAALWRPTWSVGSLQRGVADYSAGERRCRWVGARSHRRPLWRYHNALLCGWAKPGSQPLRRRLVQRRYSSISSNWHRAAHWWRTCRLYHGRRLGHGFVFECSKHVVPTLLKQWSGSSGLSAA